MSPLARRLVWIFAVLGLAAALSSLYIHHQLLAEPGYASICDINDTVSCQHAYLSRYGNVYGIPVALFGVVWFVFVLVLALVGTAGPPSIRESYPAYLFATTTIGLAVILYFAYASFFVLKTLCLFCMGTWLAVIGLFIVSGLSRSMPPMTSLPRRIVTDLRALITRPALVALVIVFLAAAASSLAFYPSEAALRDQAARAQAAQPVSAAQKSEFERYWESLPRVTLPISADGAAVLIVKFTDMQCPMCGATFFDDRPVLSKYQSQYPGAVKFVAKDYPLQPDCNSHVLRPMHTAACDAAVAVRLASQHGKGAELEEYLYGHQQMMSPAMVREAARTIGGVQDFDLQYPKVIQAVKSDVSLGGILGVSQTPTFFVNGVKVEGMTAQALDLAIEYELKKAGKIK